MNIQASFSLGPTSLVFEQVAGAGRNVKCNTFFFLAGTATCTHSDCGDRPRREDSQYHCKISPVFFVRRGLLPSFLFQRVPVIAVVVTLSFIFSFLTLLFSCENEDNGCVLSSAQVLFFLMFCVTHLVVFITSYFYSVGLPVVFTSLIFFFFGPCLILELKSFNVCCFVCYRCVSE